MSSCPNCGHVDAEDHDFCRSCGTYLRWDETPDEAKTAVLELVQLPSETLATFQEPHPAPPPVDQPTIGEPEPVEEAATGETAVVTLRLREDASSAGGAVTAAVEAGGEVELIATVRNKSEIVDSYDLDITGIPEAWWTIEPAVVHLVPFGAESGSYEDEVAVRLHPPRRPEAEARLWPIRLVAMSRAHQTEAGSARAGLVIAPYEEFESRVAPERGHGETSAQYAVPVRSGGNAPLPVSFRGEDPEGKMDFAFDPPVLTLPPGGEGTSTVTVSVERSLLGPERERSFTVYVKGGEQALAGNASFVQQPSLTRGRLVLWRIAAALLAAVMLIGGSFMNWADHPHGQPGALHGVCTTDDPSGCLRFDHYLEIVDLELGLDHPTANDDRLVLLNIVTSLGFLTILCGILVLVGIRKGRLAWMAGVVTLIALIIFLITLGNAEVDSRAGAWVVLLGGVSALTAGALATASAKSG